MDRMERSAISAKRHSPTNRKPTKKRIQIRRGKRASSESESSSDEMPQDFLSTQPPELIGRVLNYLDALDLSTVSLASKYLFQLATQDLLWKQLCETRWSDKKHQSLSLHPLVDYTGLVAQLKRSELLEILHRRFLATDDSMSDQELSTRVINTTPTGFRDVTVYAPLVCGKWQASYIAAELDKDRERITMKELQAYEWVFREQWAYDDDDDEDDAIKVKFRDDGVRLNASDVQSRPRPQTYQLLGSGKIQVGNFPRHSRPTRLDDWGWQFSNVYVTYTSV
ncbi:hypothetical protein BJ741DRAFT_596676 [Chytriomyces cf. hyalinus JEL632]|nr:hypothetical protein BJ741DRAFT_596676 [Chytriomyces cf. hyalinus JEL632]